MAARDLNGDHPCIAQVKDRVRVSAMGDGYVLRLRPDAVSRITRHLGVSRSVLQRRMGVAEATLWRVERGDVLPSNRTVAALMAVSGLGFDEIFEIVEDG